MSPLPGPPSERAGPLRVGIALAAAVLVALHLAAVGSMLTGAFRPTIALVLAESVPYAAAVGLVLAGARLPLAAILLVALAMRLALLPFPPAHSTDVYRYVWEGRIQAAGFSPYLHVPADPVLAPLRDAAIWPNINRADYAPTIYPPVAQIFFLLVTRVSETVTAMKLALVACEGVAAFALVRLLDRIGQPRERVVILAWSPLAAWEFAGNGHVDALMIALVALALLASRAGRDALAGAVLAGAVLTKFLPLALVPALWRRWDWRAPAAFAAVAALAYAPYAWSAGARVIGFAANYAGEEGLRDGAGFWFLELARTVTGIVWPTLLYVGLVAALAAGLGLAAGFGDARAPRPRLGYALALAALALLAITPQYPWYLTLLLPLLCLVPSPSLLWPLLWLPMSAYLLDWDYSRAVPWIPATVYGGALVLLILFPAASRALGRLGPAPGPERLGREQRSSPA